MTSPLHKVALLSTAEMAEADRLTIESGTPGIELMEVAGNGVAETAMAAGLSDTIKASGQIHVLCGPGNNGGDGFVAARLLKEWGRDVRLFLLGDVASLKGDAALAAGKWANLAGERAVEPLDPDKLAEADIIIDALFGAGLMRALEGDAANCVEAMNASTAYIISVDVPSGIDGNTGQVSGIAVQADITVTFFLPKPGHLLYPGRRHCGDLVVVDIGIPETVLETIRPQTFSNEPDLWLDQLPWPQEEAHKYARGHALVVSGDMAQTGASRLSAISALRVGAGLVTLACPPDALAIQAAHNTSVMLAGFGSAREFASLLKDERKNACLIGPAAGVHEGTMENVFSILATGRAAVLDADALTSFQQDPETLLSQLHKNCVLTPHEGEFEHLFPGLLKSSVSRLEAARKAAQMSGAVILLKGPDTVIAGPDGKAAISFNAPPTLATAGSGDVLAGLITGLLAAGMPAFEAACAGGWIHAEAAKIKGLGLISEDLPGLIPAVLSTLAEVDGV